jgi:hypothetical protein
MSQSGGHALSARHELANRLDLLIGLQLGPHIDQSQVLLQTAGGRVAVARQDHGAQPQSSQLFDHRSGLSPDIIPQHDAPEQLGVPNPDFRPPDIRAGSQIGQPGTARCPARGLRQPLAPSEEDSVRSQASLEPHPRDGFDARGC